MLLDKIYKIRVKYYHIFACEFFMKNMFKFLFLCIPFGLFCGGELPEVEPKEPVKQEGKIIEESAPVTCVEGDNRVLLRELNGLYFLGEKEHFPEDLNGGVQIKGVHIIDELEFKARMNCFLHHPLTIHQFKCIKKEVIRFFKEKGFLLVAVNPTTRQEVSSGSVVFVVVVAKLGAIKVEGEKYFSASSLKREISLKKGDYITANPLRGDIKWLNNNPFRTVNLIFERGEGLGESDIVLQVQDRFPARFYLGYENNGVRGVGISRLSAGFNYGNLFGIGHQLNYQFTMAPDICKWRAHSLNYVAPLPWRHTLKLLGSYIFSHPHLRKLPRGLFSVNGDTEQGSLRYIFPVSVWHRINSIIALGGDFKRTNTFIFFGEEMALKKHVEVAQLVLTYDGKLNDSLGSTSVDCNLVMSPARITHYNRGSNFHTMRPYARSHYIYFRGDLNRLFYFGKYAWLMDATVQLTGNRLVQLEQLNFTGHSAVRGYREAILSADRGIILKNELRFPPINFFSKKNIRDGLQFLLFVDFGIASNVSKTVYKIDHDGKEPPKKLVYKDHHVTLLSAGPGMRYSLNNNVSAYLDYGQRLLHFHGVKTHHRLHCGITFSY